MCNLDVRRCRQQGSTLIELLTALAAGMLVVLASLATLAFQQVGATLQRDASQLQQRLDVALHTIGWQLRQAGAVELRSLPARGTVSFSHAFDGYAGTGRALSGDDGARGRPDTLRVSHEDSTVARDCLGNRPSGDLAGVRVDSRFTVVAGELRCLGANAKTGAQVIIDGVEDFQVRYGLRDSGVSELRWHYVDAATVADRWADVGAVSVCLQILGDGRHDAATGQPGVRACNGANLPTDGKLRRVVRSTFHLRNAAS